MHNEDIKNKLEKTFEYKYGSKNFMVSDEFGNNTQVSEIEYYGYELHKLEKLLEEYVYNEEYEKADVIKNKIRLLRIKIKKL